MGEHDDLLRRYQPKLRYDSMEQFFADSAAQWTDNPGNELRRADAERRRGEVLARAGGGDGVPALSLDFLGAERYADGQPVLEGDLIGDPRPDYRKHYVALRMARPDLKNRMYGRAVSSRGRVWLQYWLWYFYNDYSLALGKGRHEGDWEMVQLRLHDEEPDLAVYAQHRYAECMPWGDVEKDGDQPVVYVARGSHASYFEAGYHKTEAWYDLADGKRATPALALEIVTDDDPPWVAWRGVWGDTRPRLEGLDQPSPTAPCLKAVWDDPDHLLDHARSPRRVEPLEAPAVTVTRVNGLLRIDFDFSRQSGDQPDTLVVTVNSRDEAGVPPQTFTFMVSGMLRGRLDTRLPVDPAKHYDVYVGTTAGDPPQPSESVLLLLPPVRGERRPPFGERAAMWLGRLFASLRGHLPRRLR